MSEPNSGGNCFIFLGYFEDSGDDQSIVSASLNTLEILLGLVEDVWREEVKP